MPTDPMVMIPASKALKRLRKRDAEYADECEQWYRQGYRPHYCKHGANLWVDWDCVCGACEDSLTIYEEALGMAHAAVYEIRKREAVRTQVYLAFAGHDDGHVPKKVRRALTDWVFEAWPYWMRGA